MADGNVARGIRLVELKLEGLAATGSSYGVSFRGHADPWRALSVIAGPSQTGKTSVIDFVRYCLGDSAHPQHPEILSKVRSALLETVLAEDPITIERAAAGPASPFASVWEAPLQDLHGAREQRLSTDPTSDPEGLSQLVMSACDLDNVDLPEAPTQVQSATQMLSIRDLFRVMWLPNDRLDSKNLLFEHSNFMVSQKLQQTIDVMFDVHDAAGNDLAARLRLANDAANEARRAAKTLREIVQGEHPSGALAVQAELNQAHHDAERIGGEVAQLDRDRRASQSNLAQLRRALESKQEEARAAALRVRNRESLVERLASLRGQYADDKKKLTFLKEAERLFDPLHVTVCPACLTALESNPVIRERACSLCGQHLPDDVATLTLGTAAASAESNQASGQSSAVLDAELRATSSRLDELNDYWSRLDGDLKALRLAQEQAEDAAEQAATALNQVVEVPAPYMAARDDLARQQSEALLREQKAAAGVRLWERVSEAEELADRLTGNAARLRAERREAGARPDRAVIVRQLSTRFRLILSEIGYPKLSDAYLDDKLMPSVRGLPYTSASSGGLVLISLAWYLALWEIAYERDARAPGLLMIDSPQKNLGHSAHPDDSDFADTRLVENFYSHAKTWLAGPGAGAQLVVVDNSPPDLVSEDVVVRYTRDRTKPPYGLIHDALD